jgi:hypothetical protein
MRHSFKLPTARDRAVQEALGVVRLAAEGARKASMVIHADMMLSEGGRHEARLFRKRPAVGGFDGTLPAVRGLKSG